MRGRRLVVRKFPIRRIATVRYGTLCMYYRESPKTSSRVNASIRA